MNYIKNPILRGFHPDPSVIRVNKDYYIATSTFEWWPGIQISHSRDLVHWETLCYALSDPAVLDLKGIQASCGIWAPCLSYDQGIYYLVFSVVRSFRCCMYDTQNYIMTARDITGPWSAPKALTGYGFDPSLFHDSDGKKYVVSMMTDHRIPKKYTGCLILQEYSQKLQSMTGPVRIIHRDSSIYLEGPHIYRRNDWYYLFAADTGTGEGHGQSVLRSHNVWGPYEMYHTCGRCDSENPAFSILTSRHVPSWPLQKAGHADLVETPDGQWYMVHLCGRPLENTNSRDATKLPGCRRYPLGRETALQKIRWTEDGWPVLEAGGILPQPTVPAPEISEFKAVQDPLVDNFDNEKLNLQWQSLRVPMDGRHMSLTARKGWIRLYGREGLNSRFEQTLLARRRSAFCFRASIKMEFHPENFKQMAGLIFLYDTENYLYLSISRDEEKGTCLAVLRSENGIYSCPSGYLPVETSDSWYLRADADFDRVQFSYCSDSDICWKPAGSPLDCSFLSDEACREGWFTGAMVGICCQDLTGNGHYADFDWFKYEEKDD